ncbi:MAG: TRAP transporter permease [Bacillota bacterium]
MRKFLNATALVALVWSLFQIVMVLRGFPHVIVMRPLHISLALALTFLTKPLFKRWSGERVHPLDALLAVASLGMGAYILLHQDRLTSRIWFVDRVFPWDTFMGILTVILLLEAARRLVGNSLPVVALAFIAYGAFGRMMPGMLMHRAISLRHFIDLQFLSPSGTFGIATGVSAEYVFYFVLFAAFLEISGGGQLFIDLALRLTGRARGGPAKSAIVASSLLGTISGSAVANVVGTGVFTIPLMKRSGYPGVFAAAVEAVASTGGQIMPPIMGAGAFIMAEMIGVPYLNVVKAALIPAIIYYVSLYFMVDLKAQEAGLKGLKASELPDLGERLLQRLHLLIPLIVLVYHMVAGFTLMMAATRAIMAVVVVSFFRKATRLRFEQVIEALIKGARSAPTVAIPCATAGLIVGTVVYTGLGLKFTSVIVNLSGGSLLRALLLVMLGCLILGMGMPTSSAYIMGAVLLAPALETLGLSRMASHLFVFYFAILSMVTPPVALASYAAAGLADSGMMETGWRGLQLSLAGFLVPFAFVFHTALIMEGTWSQTVFTLTTCLLGVYALACGIIGFCNTNVHWRERALFMLAAGLLIAPETMTDLSGAVLLALLYLFQLGKSRRVKVAA